MKLLLISFLSPDSVSSLSKSNSKPKRQRNPGNLQKLKKIEIVQKGLK